MGFGADEAESAVSCLAVVFARVLQNSDGENSEARASRIPCLTRFDASFFGSNSISISLIVYTIKLLQSREGGHSGVRRVIEAITRSDIAHYLGERIDVKKAAWPQRPSIAAAIQRFISVDSRNASAMRCRPGAALSPCATATRRSQRCESAIPTAACCVPSDILRS
jgi:hypothetical protein